MFGTLEVPGRIRVPRRMAATTMVWLLDDEGRVRPEYADHYEVVGRSGRDSTGAERDTRDAFANLAPAV